jgi:hypothetical protein
MSQGKLNPTRVEHRYSDIIFPFLTNTVDFINERNLRSKLSSHICDGVVIYI